MTCVEDHRPPAAVATLRSFRTAAARFADSAASSARIGRILLGEGGRLSRRLVRLGIVAAELLAPTPRRGEPLSGALGYQPALFLRERGINEQHERVGIGAEFGDNERGPVLHQAADEMHVAAEPVELGDDDRAGLVDLPGGLERGGELGAAVERVGTLAGLDLGEEKQTATPTAAIDAPNTELALPDRPSIAVFTNMSGDAEQEYFADGIAEDIVTALSKWRWFFVIARNSSFTYRGRRVDVKQVGRELGVRYVLEGSVRKGGNRVRVTEHH
jgi:TolB-like protein